MSAGQLINEARLRSGISLDDLAQSTKLRASILSAMEADDFSHCGGDVYARGQLRTIAPVLGLDPEDLLDAYEEAADRRPPR